MGKIKGLLVAPSEPNKLKRLGTVSNATEHNGVDLLWNTPHGLMGIQRKELKDFVASMRDGRLNKEIAQMKSHLHTAMVVVEGYGRWSGNGTLLNAYTRVEKKNVKAFLWAVRNEGMWVEWTENLSDTANTIAWFVSWTRKAEHKSLLGRPTPVTKWGTVDDRAYAIHLLTSFEGIGVEIAERIIDHFGGVPLRWDINKGQLMEVEGIGEIRASKLMKVLERNK